MAAGNRHLGFKEVLNALEERSPGSKAAFLFGFLERWPRAVRGPTPSTSATSWGVHGVRRAHAGTVCAFCRLRSQVGAITLDADALARGSG